MKKYYLPLALLSAGTVNAQLNIPVTFIVDMSQETVSPNGVHLYGSVQGYDPASTSMTDQGGGIYQVQLSLTPATVYYYVFVNGNTLGEIETVPPPCDTGISNLREFATPATGAVTLGPFCYESCGPCASANYNVTFQVDMSEETVSGNGVHIAGDWNAFSPSATTMTHQGGGVYTHTESLAGGTAVEYIFVNGNTSGDLETVPGGCNTNGHRYVTVPNSHTTLDEVCFGSCADCAVGVSDPQTHTMLIAPSISNGVVTILCPPVTRVISVVDLTGRIVWIHELQPGTSAVDLDLTPLAPGMYSVVAELESGTLNTKVVRTR